MALFKKTTTPVETTAPAADGSIAEAPVSVTPKAEAPKAPKAEKPAKKPVTTEDLLTAQADWDALKAMAKLTNPVPAELTKQITKARHTVRDMKKALGTFIPVADRPKAEKPVKPVKSDIVTLPGDPPSAGPIL